MPAKGHLGVMTVTAAGAIALALIVMGITNPVAIGPLGVTAWFLIVLAGLTGLCALIIYLIELLILHRNSDPRMVRRSWRRGLLVGFFLTTLLALSSLQQLNLRDGVLLVILLVLLEFYSVARA